MKANSISIMGHSTFGKELCDALDLDLHNVVSIDLHCKTQEVVTVLVEQHLRGQQANRMFKVLRRYEMIEKEVEQISVADTSMSVDT